MINMTNRQILVLCFLLLILNSCKDTKNNKYAPNNNSVIQIKSNNSKSTFEEKLKKEPKLFLKFWSGMTKDEFEKVVNILNEEKILLGSYNSISNPIRFLVREHCYSEIYARFDNSKEPKLVSIKLYNIATFPNCLYDLYQEKYGLPTLLQKSETDSEYIENNPNYSKKISYTDENNNLIILDEAFNDRSSFVKNNRRVEKSKFLPSRPTYMLPENPLVITKDSIVILFEQTIYKNKSYTYSLSQSESLFNYMNVVHDESISRWLEESKYIETNSKLRTVSLKTIYSINATYMSILEYNKKTERRKTEIKDSLETEKQNKEKLIRSYESI